MKYEVSNIVFKNKPSGKKMAKKYPFKRLKEQVHLVEDTPYNLCLTYKRGFSIKPHPFTEATLDNAKVNAIVLDFDHLTKSQKDFIVKKIENHSDIYGDYSAGTKTRLYENRDIPDYENPKWGYKVFFPANCLCTWKELNEAFIDAVSFFNPQFNIEKVREVWGKWVKANNRKDKISDPIFNDWILPDVAMLNSYRTQITYGVKPELKEDHIVKEFPKNDIYSQFAFPAGGIHDYNGLEWRPEDAIEDREVPEQVLSAWQNEISNAFDIEIYNVTQNQNDLKIQLPTSRSMLARRLKKQTFTDLPWDEKSNAILNARMYAKEIDFDIALTIARDSARTLTRDLLEMEYQRNLNFNRADSVKNNLNAIVHDTIVVVRQRCGLTIFKSKKNSPKQIDAKKLKEAIGKSIVSATNNFLRFRTKLKMKFVETIWNPPHMKILKDYIETKDKNLLNLYNEHRKKWIADNIQEADKVKIPYTYRKKGLKKWLVSVANLDLSTDELDFFGFEPMRLKDADEWVKWCQETLNTRHDDLNDVSEEELRRWYRDYRSEYNAKWGKLDVKIDKRTGKKNSKYDELFKDKSNDEITDIIAKLELTKQMKYKLRKQYLR